MPSRVLIDALNNLPIETVQRISPSSVETKQWMKTPMVLYVLCSSMMSSLMAVLVKLLGQLLYNYKFSEFVPAVIVLTTCLAIFTVCMVYTLNVAMR